MKKSHAPKRLSAKHTETIREDIELDLAGLMSDLISAMKATHAALRVGGMNLKYAAALGPDVEAIAHELRESGEKLRKIQAGVETLVHRSREGKL